MISGRGALLSSPLSLGLTSAVSQILLLREMVVAAYGNELSLGIMLSAWLVWVGTGSFLANFLARRYRADQEERVLSFAYGALGFSLPVCLLMIRSARPLLGMGPGEVMPLATILLLSFLLSLPLCLLLGFLFVLNARFFARTSGGPGQAVSFVYLWEAIGAFLGGMLCTYLFIPHLSNLKISFLILLLNLLIALDLFRWPGTRRLLVVNALLLAFFLLSFFFGLPSALDRLSWRFHWRGLNLLDTRDTLYGNVAVTKRWGQVDLFENGLRLFSYPDPAAAEEGVHFALLQHPAPQSLFLLGGGVGGGVAQALKYPKLTIDYAELDPQVIDLAARHIPPEASVLQDPRVRVRYGDGRLLLSQSNRRYDLIILNLPDPRTLQLNRFYTREFFQIVKDHLEPVGVFSFRVSSSENYLSEDLARYLALIQNTLGSVFAEVVAFPGETCLFFASPQRGLLLRDSRELAARLRERQLNNQYVNEFLIPFRLHPFKMNYLNDRLMGQDARINRDLEPLCHLYGAALWASQFGAWERSIFPFLMRTSWVMISLCLLALLASLVFLGATRGSLASGAVLGSVFVAGLTSISLEIIALLAFQISYGFIYHKLGLLLAAFMLGLGIGASWGRRAQGLRRWLLTAQAALMGCCVLFFLALRGSMPSAGSSGWVEVLSFFFLLAVGALGGLQFCLANALWVKSRSQAAWGTLYAVDLWGSALGALLFSALLLPLWGILKSLLLLTFINLAAWIFLVAFVKEAKAKTEYRIERSLSCKSP